MLDVFTNEAGKTILRVQTVRNVFRRLNPEFIEFDLAPDAIEPASLDDLQAEVASYEAVLQRLIWELVRYARNGKPFAKSNAWRFSLAMLISCLTFRVLIVRHLMKREVKASMLTKEHVAQLLQERNAYLASEFGVRRIGLFGSLARDLAREGSDIDLVVEFERPIGLRFMELGDYLESLLGHEVDLLTPAGIQAIRSQAIRQEISESIVYV